MRESDAIRDAALEEGAGVAGAPTAVEAGSPTGVPGGLGLLEIDPMLALRNAEARAARAQAAAERSFALLRQVEPMIQRLQAERDEALLRARQAERRADGAEQQLRDLAVADRTELDAAILRASEALADLDEAKRRALDAEWRAARAEARVEQLLKATQLHTPATVAGAMAGGPPRRASP